MSCGNRHGGHYRIVLVADPLDESNGGLWDGGYDEVDERLSAAFPKP